MNVSEIISKRIVELRTARILGTVINVKFSPTLKKAENLLLLDENENDETFLSLGIKNLFAFRNEFLVVKSINSPLLVHNGGTFNPINLPACNQDGKTLGKITDVSLNENYTVKSFILGKTEFDFGKLLSFSESLVIFNDSGKRITLPKLSSHAPSKTDLKQMIVKAFELTTDIPQSPSAIGAAPTSFGVATPTAASMPPSERHSDFSFLVGKRIARDLYSSAGKLIAACGSVITFETIKAAGKDNKLVQLTIRAL